MAGACVTDIKRKITGEIKIIAPPLPATCASLPKSHAHIWSHFLSTSRALIESDQTRGNSNWLVDNACTVHVRAGFINLSERLVSNAGNACTAYESRWRGIKGPAGSTFDSTMSCVLAIQFAAAFLCFHWRFGVCLSTNSDILEDDRVSREALPITQIHACRIFVVGPGISVLSVTHARSNVIIACRLLLSL